jgi:GT2 family glycosyltransferase
MAQVEPDLSIIILNFNVKELLINCLDSILKNKTTRDNWQIIVVDNASVDGSAEAIIDKIPQVELVVNKNNLGFAAGNNVGVKKAKAPVVLFLNPDTVVQGQAIENTYEYLMGNPDIGAITCRVELPDGKLDYSSHRGFPTPWNSLTYFSGLAKLFPRSPFFAGYTATYLDISETHEIDCLTGAFLMVRKIAGEQIGWWDKDYFWNGEDIEFCYSLKEKGWKIYFYPDEKIIHYKGSSSGLWKTAATQVDKEKRLAAVKHGVSAMRIFYKKHYYEKYPPIIRDLIFVGIKMLEHYRKAMLELID